ncbi:MAG TPA: serine/threonine-protein kinase, partial [Xanthomonadales bacterium]|nr:serine/threonine-protein kinase [Xanthomonadales bacterium]
MSEQQGGAVDAPGYEIVRRIGGTEGADVHLARQQALGREVALKVLRSAAQDTEQLERFAFETRTAAALLHPHIVPLLDSGTTRDGRPYYAMPWLAGGDLASRLPLPPVEVRRVGLALCDALWYAHGRNVVHRDIKPSNILFDDTGRPLLADFGIATSIIGSRGLTLPGRTLGAARYISPEQARGEKVDPRADLYSLAVVLFEALTGSPPFVAGDDVATAALHATAAVPRLPEPHARWQPFFDRALAKAPADRFMSARTMAQALELIDTGDAAAIPAPVAVAAVPLAAAAAAATPGDDLPHMRMEPPSYLEGAPRPQPARRANRFAGAAVLLGVIALAAIVGYALTRDEDERFQPLAVTPGSSAPMPVPSPAAAPPPDAVEPGKVTAAAATPAAASTPKPATRAPAPAASSGPDEDDGLPGEDLDGEPAPS